MLFVIRAEHCWKRKLSYYAWQPRYAKPKLSRSVPLKIRPCFSSAKLKTPQTDTITGSSKYYVTPSLTASRIKTHVVVSIVEGRGNAAGEIGIAAIDLFSPNVELSQFRDTSSYSRTLVKLLILCPTEIIVPHTALERSNSMQKLFHVLQGFRTTSPILGVHRTYFNDKQGLADLRRYCHPDYLALIYAIKERFYSLAAAASLFHYVEESYAILHAPCSLKFTFTGSIQTTMIDFNCAARLELVENTADHTTKNTLYAAVNFTCTPGGARLLRANILEPPCDLPTIMQRQDAITELASAPETLLALQNILRQLPHIDGLLSLCVQICRPPTEASFTPTGLSVVSNSSHSAVGPKDFTKPIYQPNTESSAKSGVRDPSTNDKISAQAAVSERISWSVPHCNESSACKISLNPQTAETRITRVIAIKNLLDLVPVLHNALGTVRSGLLTTYKELLSDPGYDNVLKKLCTVLHNDVRLSKGMLAMRSQKCFAIKEGINVILDVTRKAYSEQLDDVTIEVSRLARKLKLPLRVAHNKIRGFYIQFPEASLGVNSEEDCFAASQSSETQYSIRDYPRNLKDMTIQSCTQSTGQKEMDYSNDESTKAKTSALPPELIKPLYSRGVIHCTTESLIRLNERMKGSLNEVYFIADQIICDLIVSLQPEMSLFYRLSEVVASLDLLASFARLVVSSSPRNHFTYPKFTDRLAIKNGRNIVLEHQSTASIVPNHTYTSKDLSLTILTGPNMCGKTTYLRQIAYIQILAQVGSLVPAEFASVRMMNQIFYHSSGADDIVSNDSSFTKEMKEMSYVLRHSTDASLVLIDGLCQSTNPQEAIGLIWAICEALLEKKVFTFLATQFPEITQLANFYSNVEVCHFLVHEDPTEVESSTPDRIYPRNFLESSPDQISFNDECNVSTKTNSFLHNEDPGTNSFTIHSRPKLTFTYKLHKGVSKRRPYALEIAHLTAIPEEVIIRAEELVHKLSAGMTTTKPPMQQEPGGNEPSLDEAVPQCASAIQCTTHNTDGPASQGRPAVSESASPARMLSTSECRSESLPVQQCTRSVVSANQQRSSTAKQFRTTSDENSSETATPQFTTVIGTKGEGVESTCDGTANRLAVELLRQLTMLAKLLTEPADLQNDVKQEVLSYIRFLKDRYRPIISKIVDMKNDPMSTFL
ncbi:hypothetical protein P879_04370 [Paragonimus westermani]|uniref:DNA mismatch repair protein MSH4 n=1 Tax=Paragonimus westermani TaxID=34504 RepID=A0A8T0DM36_9TREM|nr:hypothetical protein P879_04370 [Paragonimus westermani]